MVKPVVNTFSGLAPLIIHQYERYLPTAFDESMSLVQKVNKVIVRLDELGMVVGDVVNQWNSVMQWVMSEGLNDAVIERLNKMVSDGTFNTLINETILGSKATIILSAVEPLVSDNTTYWYEDKGDAPINFDLDNGNTSGGNVIVEDDEPANTKSGQLWFDIE